MINCSHVSDESIIVGPNRVIQLRHQVLRLIRRDCMPALVVVIILLTIGIVCPSVILLLLIAIVLIVLLLLLIRIVLSVVICILAVILLLMLLVLLIVVVLLLLLMAAVVVLLCVLLQFVVLLESTGGVGCRMLFAAARSTVWCDQEVLIFLVGVELIFDLLHHFVHSLLVLVLRLHPLHDCRWLSRSCLGPRCFGGWIQRCWGHHVKQALAIGEYWVIDSFVLCWLLSRSRGIISLLRFRGFFLRS